MVAVFNALEAESSAFLSFDILLPFSRVLLIITPTTTSTTTSTHLINHASSLIPTLKKRFLPKRLFSSHFQRPTTLDPFSAISSTATLSSSFASCEDKAIRPRSYTLDRFVQAGSGDLPGDRMPFIESDPNSQPPQAILPFIQQTPNPPTNQRTKSNPRDKSDRDVP